MDKLFGWILILLSGVVFSLFYNIYNIPFNIQNGSIHIVGLVLFGVGNLLIRD